MSIIEIKDLHKVYDGKSLPVYAVNGIDIKIEAGEFTAVVGPSGSGKTTLLNIVGGLDEPTEGEVFIDGVKITGLSGKEKTDFRMKNIGFVFQSFNLIDELNVYENVELPLIYLKLKARERKEMVEKVLERMKISHRRKHFPQQLSGGQQQRVAIARAVVANPKLILADEPTGNLDSKNGLEVMNLLTELNREGTTIVMVTHSLHDSEFAHRVINLFDGQIITEELKKQMSELLI